MSQSLQRALMILRALAERESTLDELAEHVGVHKTTVMRLLRTLEDDRFVSKVDARRFRLGSAVFDLSHRALEGRDVRAAAHAALAELNRTTGHTVHLATYESGSVVYVDKVDSTHPVRMYSRIGKTAPLHCTAVAKVLLADLPVTERTDLARSLHYERKTGNTITSARRFLEELATVAECGHAVDKAEHEDFVNCVAVPVRGVDSSVVAAMSITVPTVLGDFDDVMTLLPSLKKAAEAASLACGADRTGKAVR